MVTAVLSLSRKTVPFYFYPVPCQKVVLARKKKHRQKIANNSYRALPHWNDYSLKKHTFPNRTALLKTRRRRSSSPRETDAPSYTNICAVLYYIYNFFVCTTRIVDTCSNLFCRRAVMYLARVYTLLVYRPFLHVRALYSRFFFFMFPFHRPEKRKFKTERSTPRKKKK